MSKLQQTFSFTHTFKKPVVRDSDIVDDTLEVYVNGLATLLRNDAGEPNIQIDFNYALYSGVNVLEILTFFDELPELYEAAVKYAEEHFFPQAKEVAHV